GRASDQDLRRLQGGGRYQFHHRAGRDIRPVGAQRGGEIHHLQDALRAVAADERRWAGRRDQPGAGGGRGAPETGLYGAEILALWRSHRVAEPEILFRRLWPEGGAPEGADGPDDREL